MRILATIIDYGFYLLLFTSYVLYFGHKNSEGGETVEGLAALPLPLFWFLYFIIFESLFDATPGHLLLHLKVLTIERKRISFGQAFKRHIMDFFDVFFYGIPAIIAIRNTEKHQRIGDLWAKTIVVDTTDTEQY